MTSTLSDVRDGLKAQLVSLGLNVYRQFTDVVNTPAVVIDLAKSPSIDYAVAFNQGGDRYNFDLYVLVAALNIENAQTILDGYVSGHGPKSIRGALFQNSSLGLSDVDCMATQLRGYGGAPEVAGTKMIGAIVRVIVTVG